MGVVTCNYEMKSSVPVSKMFKAIVLDRNSVFPKAVPTIKSIDVLQGDGGPGSLTQTNFVDGFPFKYMKHKANVVDASNYFCNFSVIGGDIIEGKYEKADHELKFEAAGDGCVMKVQSHYHTKGDIKEEDVRAEHAQEMEGMKLVEKYLLDNPSYA